MSEDALDGSDDPRDESNDDYDADSERDHDADTGREQDADPEQERGEDADRERDADYEREHDADSERDAHDADSERDADERDRPRDADEPTEVPVDDSVSDDEPVEDDKPAEGVDANDPGERRERAGRGTGAPDRGPPRTDTGESDGKSGHWLSSLLTALDRLERGSESLSGRRETDRTVLDYDISIRSGDEVSDERPPLDSNPFDDAERSTGRPRKRRRYPSGGSDEHRLTTRSHEDELLVTADVGGTDPDDVTVGFDDSTLVVAVSGREVDRVDVPWEETTSDATIKNGVLTVQIRPGSDASAETEDDR